MTTLKIGGVPEYFNLPIYQAIENGAFAQAEIDLQWQDIKEGTGRMSQMLASGELDLAVILTEGITKSIIDGNPSRIIKSYVSSPLQWGVHVPPGESLDTITKRKIAISRFGSGSHLMSFILAKRKAWQLEESNFVVVNNLDGAIESFAKGESNIFLWEKYTTQPYVDQGHFERADIQPTPWPCFVMAANQKSLDENIEAIAKTCEIINESCRQMQSDPDLANIIVARFGLSKSDAKNITTEVRWSLDNAIDHGAIKKVIETFTDLKLIAFPVEVERVVKQVG